MRVRLAGGAALLAIAAGLVFVYLPRTLPPPATPTPEPATAPAAKPPASLEVPGPAPFELAKLARARDEAQELVDKLVDLQQIAESRGALQWAADDYAAATARAQAGDGLFKSQDFDGARAAYQEAEQALESLLARAPGVLADSVKAGWAAYDANDRGDGDRPVPARAEGRSAAHRRAARIATRAVARAGAARPWRRVRSPSATATARRRSPPVARRARSIPSVAAARDAVQRLSGQIARSQFDEAMSQGFAALDRGDAGAARAAFTHARTLDPGSSAAADALAQVEGRVRAGQFEQKQDDAAAAEAAERWADAAAVYDQALAIDPTLVFAQKGATHAREMAKLHQQMDEMIASPERLASDSVYANAQALVRAASALPGDQLGRKRVALGGAARRRRARPCTCVSNRTTRPTSCCTRSISSGASRCASSTCVPAPIRRWERATAIATCGAASRSSPAQTPAAGRHPLRGAHLTRSVRIRDARGERLYRPADFPLIAGGRRRRRPRAAGLSARRAGRGPRSRGRRALLAERPEDGARWRCHRDALARARRRARDRQRAAALRAGGRRAAA